MIRPRVCDNVNRYSELPYLSKTSTFHHISTTPSCFKCETGFPVPVERWLPWVWFAAFAYKYQTSVLCWPWSFRPGALSCGCSCEPWYAAYPARKDLLQTRQTTVTYWCKVYVSFGPVYRYRSIVMQPNYLILPSYIGQSLSYQTTNGLANQAKPFVSQ